MDVREFQENRARFPLDELMKHVGQWVAFSSDGRRIIAGHEDLAVLNALILEAGEDPQDTGLEWVEFGDDSYCGVESY